MRTERAYQFAHCSALLLADPKVPGHEAIFDQALTNGLAAIVAHQWPGREAKKDFMLPAAGLLKVVTENATEQADGTHLLTWTEPTGEVGRGVVDSVALSSGIAATQASRHARGSGTLEQRHIDALVALDEHPALRRISEVDSDGQWIQAEVQDLYERQRAEAYREFIGDDEAEARAERAPELLEYAHPRHNPEGAGAELEDCAVCQYTAFKLDFPAVYPDTGSGACLACSYTRTPDVSYYLTLNAEMASTFTDD